MESIRKTTALLLCAVFCFCGVAWNASAQETAADNRLKYDFIKNMGYLEGISISNEAAVSGKEFAKIMENAVGNSLIAVYPGLEQTEVLKSIDAVKVILDLAGYEPVLSISGGYPAGYADCAAKTGLTRGLSFSGGAPASMEFLSGLLYNAMDLPMVEISYTDGAVSYEAGDETFGRSVLKLEKISGIVTANAYSGIDRGGVGEGNLCIDGVTYLCAGGFNGDHLLGYAVEAYRICDEKELRFAMPDKKSEILTIAAADVAGFSGGALRYYDGQREKREVLSDAALVIQNGAVLGNYTQEEFLFEYGSVTLVRRSGAGSVDLVVIQAYTDFLVSHNDVNNRILYNKLDGKKLVLDENKHVVIRDTAGTVLAETDIKAYDVLSVADSSVSTEIIVSREILNPFVIMRTGEEENRQYISSADRRLPVGTAYLQYCNGTLPVVGSSVSVYLNAFGGAAYISAAGQTLQYGYLLRSGVNDLEEPFFKILTGDNEIAYFECADKVKVYDENGNERNVKREDIASRFLNYEGVVVYRANEEGKLNYLASPLDEKGKENQFYEAYAGSQVMYKSWAGCFGGQAYIDDRTYIFSIPENRVSNDQCEVLEKSDMANGTMYDYTAYCMGNNDILATCVVITNYLHRFGEDGGYYIVTDIETGVANTGEIVQTLSCSNGEKSVKYRAEVMADGTTAFDRAQGICGTETLQVEKGDIIRCMVSKKTGLVETAYVLFDNDGVNPDYPEGQPGVFPTILGNAPQEGNRSNPLTISGSSYASPQFNGYGTRYFYGWVYNKAGNYITVTNQDLSYERFENSSAFYIENHFVNIYDCTAVNYSDNGAVTVKAGGIGDIVSYMDGGDACSRVIMITKSQGDPVQMIVLNS